MLRDSSISRAWIGTQNRAPLLLPNDHPYSDRAYNNAYKM